LPGDFIAERPVNSFIHPAGLPIATPLAEALRRPRESAINLPIIMAAALWTSVLLIVLAVVADAMLGLLDPKVRDAAF
jgi:hypothetical protein